MTTYSAPLGEIGFLLAEVLRIGRYANLASFAEAAPDVVTAILAEGGRFAEAVLAPLNRSGDQQGCTRHADGSVTTPEGFASAYAQHVASGWGGVSADPAYGGQGLPFMVATALNEIFASANLALSLVPGLSLSAYAAILAHGSADQKARYLPRIVTGAWASTMNLTEPQCGTDLGLIRTRAERRPDGGFAVRGQKIFITGGEHDLAANIVHLVLARIEDAPPGTKGLSLFIVPKFLPDAEGGLGPRNGLSCGAIERKMGIHGSPTCVMNYDDAVGELLGQENRGLQAMFVMMNEARIGVANQGLALSEVAYQNAAAYARDRLQGRALSGARAPDRPADPLLVHPDIRRILVGIRAFNEAARALVLWTALQSDLARGSPDPPSREAAEDLLGLLTPVIKGVLTDIGFRNCVEAQQVFGGHGYIAEWGMEQFVRDARIAMIYEGANGIQALDLVARKLPRHGGRAFLRFTAEVAAFLKAQAGEPAMRPYCEPLEAGLGRLKAATQWLMQHAMANPDHAGAGSTDYMHLVGLVALGFMSAQIAAAALAVMRREPGVAPAMQARLLRSRCFMERMMPETAAHLARVEAGADTLMAMPDDAF